MLNLGKIEIAEGRGEKKEEKEGEFKMYGDMAPNLNFDHRHNSYAIAAIHPFNVLFSRRAWVSRHQKG